ncbi:MAG: hypothetical protein H7Y17_15120 [Chlorobia bacterium]|nr:hypothetical protein [Fimbriimonadaceae bacterium]
MTIKLDDPYALMVKQKMIGQVADALKDTKHPLVPHSVVTMGGGGSEGNGGDNNMLTHMLTLLLTDKLGLTDIGKGDESVNDDTGPEARAFLKKIMASMGGNESSPAREKVATNFKPLDHNGSSS